MKKSDILKEILSLKEEKFIIEEKIRKLEEVYNQISEAEKELKLVIGVCFDKNEKVYYYIWEENETVEVGDTVQVERYHKMIPVTVVEIKIADVSKFEYELKTAKVMPYDEVDLSELLKSYNFVMINNTYRLSAVENENKSYGYLFTYDIQKNEFLFEKVYNYENKYEVKACRFDDETKKFIMDFMWSKICPTPEKKAKISIYRKMKS